jgi:hypothetical protein
MRRFVTSACLLAAAALAVTAVAIARPAGIAAAPAGVKKVDCRKGDSPQSRSATFEGRMQALPGTRRMWMRFTLLQRGAQGPFTPVQERDLKPWRKSRRGVGSFNYSQTVNNLRSGATYRMRVSFRWLGRGGKLIRTARRISGVCAQSGPLPNLEIQRVDAMAGADNRTVVYSAEVVNSGEGAAQKIGVTLAVDGAELDAGEVDSLGPGEARTVKFNGPPCRNRIVATVDPRSGVPEVRERDNVLRTGCPPGSS